MSPSHVPPLTETARLSIIDLIKASGLQSGDKLPTVGQLALQLSVSRTVVREAIASLKAEGWLRSQRGSGIFVLALAELVATADGMQKFETPSDDDAELMDWMELRIAIEVEAAGLAAERRSDKHLFALERSLTRHRRQISTGVLSGNPDLEFHNALAVATGNPRFQLFVRTVGERLIPEMDAIDDIQLNCFDKALSEHTLVFQAVSGRDGDAARSSMQRHLRFASRCYRQRRIKAGLANGDIPRSKGS